MITCAQTHTHTQNYARETIILHHRRRVLGSVNIQRSKAWSGFNSLRSLSKLIYIYLYCVQHTHTHRHTHTHTSSFLDWSDSTAGCSRRQDGCPLVSGRGRGGRKHSSVSLAHHHICIPSTELLVAPHYHHTPHHHHHHHHHHH